MSVIYLVRHGQYANPKNIMPGRLPVELDEEGRAQLERARDYLADKHIARIFSSPVRRCEQSAEILSGGKLEIVYDLRLAETLTAVQGDDFTGEWIQSFYSHVDKLGGESMPDVQARMVDFWKSLDFESGQNYVVCSHGDPLQLLYNYLLGDKSLLTTATEHAKSYQPKGSIRPIIARSPTDYDVQAFLVP